MGTTRSLAAGHLPYRLLVDGFKPFLDIYAFEGEEALSEPYCYRIQVTCTEQDIDPKSILNQAAHFHLFTPPQPKCYWSFPPDDPV